MATIGEWQQVTRRQRFPAPWRAPASSQRPSQQTYTLFVHLCTYAQALTSNPLSPAQPSPNPKPPSSPPSPAPPYSLKTFSQIIYYSPHSPTKLRFPPSPRFEEWRGRCFRCCRTDHNSGTCRFPSKCDRCWGEGHVRTRCKESKLDPSAISFQPARRDTSVRLIKRELDFDDLLMGTYPIAPLVMPDKRPNKTFCFVDRDPDYFKIIKKKKRV